MALRKANGKWHYRFQVDGLKVAETTGLADTRRNEPRARMMESQHRQAVSEGKWGLRRLEQITFSDASELFLAQIKLDHAAKPGTWKRVETSMSSLTAHFGKMLVSSVRPKDVEAYKSWRLTDHKVEGDHLPTRSPRALEVLSMGPEDGLQQGEYYGGRFDPVGRGCHTDARAQLRGRETIFRPCHRRPSRFRAIVNPTRHASSGTPQLGAGRCRPGPRRDAYSTRQDQGRPAHAYVDQRIEDDPGTSPGRQVALGIPVTAETRSACRQPRRFTQPRAEKDRSRVRPIRFEAFVRYAPGRIWRGPSDVGDRKSTRL